MLEGAGCHFEVWQGSILRWRLLVSAYDRMLPTLSSWGLEVWEATGLFCPPFVPLSQMDLDTACFRGRGRGCNWFFSPLWFCLWLSGNGRVSAPRIRWIKWQRMKFKARSRSTDRWSNLTSSAPDRSPECDGERLNWLLKGLVLYIRADSMEMWEAGLMREITVEVKRTSSQIWQYI